MRRHARDLLRRALGRNPLDAIGILLLLVAAGAILVNALYRQPGPHPAPIFSVKPRPVATEPAEVVPPAPRTRSEPRAGRRPAPQQRSRPRLRSARRAGRSRERAPKSPQSEVPIAIARV